MLPKVTVRLTQVIIIVYGYTALGQASYMFL